MKSKKYLFGSIATGVTLCAVLAFNSFVFPSVLAATNEDSKVQTISVDSIAQTLSTTQPADSENAPDVNAVSKEQAIESAINGLEEFQYADDFKTLPCTVKYVKGTAPANEPLWVVIFAIVEEDAIEIIPNGANDPKYADAETDDEGNAILHLGDMTGYIIVDVNALTGEYITHVDYSMGNDPEDKLDSILNEEYGSALDSTK